jgi:hypothetical protein
MNNARGMAVRWSAATPDGHTADHRVVAHRALARAQRKAVGHTDLIPPVARDRLAMERTTVPTPGAEDHGRERDDLAVEAADPVAGQKVGRHTAHDVGHGIRTSPGLFMNASPILLRRKPLSCPFVEIDEEGETK